MAEDWVTLPFPEAIAYLKALRPTPIDVFAQMEAEAQATAFTVAGVTKLEFLQEILDQLRGAVSEGTSLSDFVSSFSGSGLTDAHLETIYRTNVQSAYGAGLWEQGTNSDIASEIWGWRYHTVGDDRVREEHADLDDMTFETGEGDEVFPPWDYNCRCSAEWITNSDAADEGLTSDALPDNVFTALGETDFTSPALDQQYEPSMAGIDPGLIAEFINGQGE